MSQLDRDQLYRRACRLQLLLLQNAPDALVRRAVELMQLPDEAPPARPRLRVLAPEGLEAETA